jgi:hypothetical protein
MKISFTNCGSGAGVSIRAAINALLNGYKAERTQIAHRKKNVPQITSGWDYRPREVIRRYAAVDAARTETAETLSSSPSAAAGNNAVWFDSIDTNPAAEDARKKAPLWGRAYAGPTYD